MLTAISFFCYCFQETKNIETEEEAENNIDKIRLFSSILAS